LADFARSRHPFFHFLICQPAIAGWQNLAWQAGEELPTALPEACSQVSGRSDILDDA